MTVLQPELVARLAASFPDGVAWRDLAGGEVLTLADWHGRSDRLARGLQHLGVARGDRVGLLIGNEEPLRWLISYLGIHKAGAVAVPLLARLGPLELSRILQDAGVTVALCSEIVPEVGASVRTVVGTAPGSGLDWEDLLADDDRDVRPANDPDDVADIMYTSGTTGRPKGVLVRHGSLSTTARVPSDWLGLGFLTSSPFATTSGSLLVTGPLRGGLSGWFLPHFSAAAWLDAVAQERPVSAFLVPAMVELVVASPLFATSDLSSLAVVTVGSAPIAAATLRRFGAGLPQGEVLCGYGMTEFGAVTAMPMGDSGRHLGSVGLPLPGVDLRITGPDGAMLPPGEVGEVTIKGTAPARSALADEDGHAEDWRVDGWLRSGDLGFVDADGHLWLVGRKKEIIIRGGHNVVPGEVEEALYEHPAVVEAAVAGLPHAVLGEDVAAWVVLRDDTSDEELRGFLLARLADYKVPRRITVVDMLPRNESGKVVKSRLEPGVEPA